MKLIYKLILVALSAAFVCLPAQQARAQLDTLAVEWDTNGDGIPVLNALRDAVIADTLADGSHAPNHLYKLRRGGFYWNPDVIDNVGFHLRVVGEEPTAEQGPAVLQNVQDAGGNVSSRMFGGQSSLTLKNLYIMGQDDLGDQGTRYQPLQIDASGSRFVFEGCIFERSNFAIVAFTGSNNSIFFRDNMFRNLVSVPITQQWEGRGVSIWADQDSVVFENNTFFLCHMTAIQIEQGAPNFFLANHNTFVNIGRSINTGNWWREAYWANNLIYNGFWHSEGVADLSGAGRDPRATTSGLFSIGALPSKYGLEEGRKIVFTNTSAFLDQTFIDYYADSLLVQPFINPVTREDFIDQYEAMVIQDTIWADPGLATTTPEIYDAMIAAINALRAGMDGEPYFWMIPEDPVAGGRCHVCPSWPLPEDFSYTNMDLLTGGTDGLPLGDLNWFPADKAQYLASRDQYLDDIKSIGPQPPVFEVRGTTEAEVGALGGDAAIEPFQGFGYYQMDAGGFIEWTFDLPTGGISDLIVSTHLRGNSTRGESIEVNGTNLRNWDNAGEFRWGNDPDQSPGGDPINEWFDSEITQAILVEGAEALDLPQGQNVVRISAVWGYQHFSGIKIVQDGTTVIELGAADVTAHDLVIPVGEGKPWTPSEFNSVALNTNGSVTWNMNVAADGMYRLRIFYQNYSGVQSGEIQVGGMSAVNLTFDSVADSTGLDLVSDGFDLSAGSNMITLSGSQVKVDYVQLLEEIISSVSAPEQLPDGFALEQNYPNPFNPETTIRYELGRQGPVSITIYNILGHKVKTLVNEVKPAGAYRAVWDGKNDLGLRVSTGMYIYRFKAGDIITSRKMLLLK